MDPFCTAGMQKVASPLALQLSYIIILYFLLSTQTTLAVLLLSLTNCFSSYFTEKIEAVRISADSNNYNYPVTTIGKHVLCFVAFRCTCHYHSLMKKTPLVQESQSSLYLFKDRDLGLLPYLYYNRKISFSTI